MAQNYDVTLKTLLRDSAGRAVYTATGLSIETWLDTELPKVANPRLDLLGETHDGSLLHLELQIRNDANMAKRMAEYALAIYRIYDKFARQIVLYAGESDLRMATSLEGPRFTFSFEVIDLRDLNGEALLASDNVGDNVLAIVTRLRDQRSAIDEILRKIATLDDTKRQQAIEQLLILAGLRKLARAVQEGIHRMDYFRELILNNEVLGPEYKRGLEEGELKGKLEGELTVLRRLLQRRFGAIPQWAEERLSRKGAEDLEALSVRILDATSLEQLLP
jgi:predicted transposase YdaD